MLKSKYVNQKMGTLKYKSINMNDNYANYVTDQPITLDNEATPNAVFFAVATAITPDSYLLPSGLKLDTGIFFKRNIKNMADKDKIDTTPTPTHPKLILLMLLPNIMAPTTPITHINLEIVNLPPTPPLPWKP